MEKRTVSVHVDLGALTGRLQRRVQRIIDVVSFGLVTAASSQEQALALPSVFFRFQAASERFDFGRAKTEFTSWLLAAGFRDAIELLSSFLEEVRSACAVWSLPKSGTTTGEDWHRIMHGEARKFHRLGLRDKLRWIRDHYGEQLLPPSTESILTVNAARNCLVHRRGIVSALDKNHPAGLAVTWNKPQLFVAGAAGERAMEGPGVVVAGEKVLFRATDTTKVFRMSESLTFSPQEFSEVCWTLVQFAMQVCGNLEKYARELGITFSEGTNKGL